MRTPKVPIDKLLGRKGLISLLLMLSKLYFRLKKPLKNAYCLVKRQGTWLKRHFIRSHKKLRYHLLVLHFHTAKRSKWYHRWHQHKHHNKIHWLAFASHAGITFGLLFLVVVQFFGLGSYAANTVVNADLKTDWDAGTNSEIDTEDTFGSIKINSDGNWGPRTFQTPPDYLYYGTSMKSDGTYLYAFKGNGENDFWRYNPATNTWTTLANTPVGVYAGADLARGPADTFYAIFGNYNRAFYKYTISTDTWTKLGNTPDTTGPGSNLAWADDTLYCVRGQTTQDFWKYTESSGWDSATGTLNTISDGDLIYDGGNYLYILRGVNSSTFYRFNIATPGWVAMTTNYPVNVNWQTSGVYQDGAIYIQHGNGTTTMNKCIISGTTCSGGWQAQTPQPAISYYGSMSTHSADNLIYILRGQSSTTVGTTDLWKYNPTTNTYIGPAGFSGTAVAPAPTQTMTTGADLIWDGDNYVYGLKGQAAANGFWRYNITTSAWESRAIGSLPTLSYDTKGVRVGNYLYIFQGNNANMYRFDTTGDAGWALETSTGISAISNGGGLAYPGSGDYIYATRGGGNLDFYAYSITNQNWTTFNPTDLPTGAGVNIGGRIVGLNGKIYVMLGNSNSSFYEYTYDGGTGGSWVKVGRVPFAPYYGSDFASYDGKIYALAGYYKNKVYEFDGTSWRKLPNLQTSLPLEIGPYLGASIEPMGANGLMVAYGNATSEITTFSLPVTRYKAEATYESPVYDLSYVESWTAFTKDETIASDTEVTYKTNVSSDGVSWDGWVNVSGTTIGSAVSKRYLKVRIVLKSNNARLYSPEVKSYSVTYVGDTESPTNPAIESVVAKSQQSGGSDIISGQDNRYGHPYFSWGNGGDNNKSGVVGYYVYFGTSSDGNPSNPAEADAVFVASPEFVVNQMMETGTYYLRIKAKDLAGNVADTALDAFTYSYIGVSPKSSITKDTTEEFDTSGRELTNISSNDGKLKLSGKSGFWFEGRLSLTPSTVSQGGSMVYKSAQNKLYVLRGGASTTFWEYNIATDAWTALSSTGLTNVSYGGGLVDGPGNYIYAISGNGTSKTYRYDTVAGGNWDDAAIEDTPLAFNLGGTTIVKGNQVVGQNANYIYALRGNNDADFYRFDPTNTSDGQWSAKTNVDFGASVGQTLNNNIGYGSALSYDGASSIYAIQGALRAGGFAKYTIPSDPAESGSWQYLDPLPQAPNYGATLEWDSVTGRLFYLPGSRSNKMFKYNPANNEWTQASNAPVTFGALSGTGGTFITSVDGTFYVLRGSGTTGFYKYDTTDDYWYTPAFNLFGPNWYGTGGAVGATYFGVDQGGDLAQDSSNNIYMVRGNRDTGFVKYNAQSGATQKLKDVPTGIYDGTAMVVAGNYLYLVVGTIERTFFKYSIVNDSWEEQESDLPPVGSPGSGASMVYDGSRYIYYLRGGNTNQWYSYDTDPNTPAGSRWSAALPTTGLSTYTFGGGSELVYKNGIIYALRAQAFNPNQFFSFDTANLPAGSWNTLSSLGVAVTTDGFLTDGGDGYLYCSPGGNVNTWWRYNISQNSWAQVTPGVPAQVNRGGAGTSNLSNRISLFAGTGTNSYADGLYTYIPETADSSFYESGSYISEAMDLTGQAGKPAYDWANLTINYNEPSNTNALVETSTALDLAGTWSSWSEVSQSKVTNTGTYQYAINSPYGRYLKVRISLTSGNGVSSPTINSYTINYYKDLTAPENPTALKYAKSKQIDGSDIVSESWINSTEPYFELLPEGEAGAGTDGNNGSGVSCYYVIFDTDENATPSTETTCKTELGYAFSPTEEGETYHLLVQTKDKAGNTQGVIKELFEYKYDKTGPTFSAEFEIAVNPVSYTAVDNYTFTVTTAEISDLYADIQKYQYRTGEDSESTWYDFDPLTNASVTIPNGNHPTGKYRTGINKFYFRVLDGANNVSVVKDANYYFGETAPSPPQNLEVTPATPSPTNSFTFEWDAPATYVGDPSKIVYYYSVGPEPTQYNVNMTVGTAVGPGPFATQKGENRFFVVAKDEAGNIDYGQYASITFTADTSAPAAPTYVTASDISDKEAEQYRLVISWMAPDIGDPANFAGYDIYESSSENGSYTKVDNTSGTAYVHTGLVKESVHYYYIKSIDKTRNESAASSTATATASGRYTRPPNVVDEPEAEPKAKSATVTWSTSREANSAVLYDTDPNMSAPENEANPYTLFRTNHEVIVRGLNPGTTYYYKGIFADPDGNIGETGIGSFITSPAPLISNMKVEDISLDSMLITWDSNVPSYGSIAYGRTATYGFSEDEEPYFTRHHVVKLKNLESGRDYYLQVRALDEEGNSFISDQYVYQTMPYPEVTNLKFENKKEVDSPTVVFSYNSNVETTTVVRYSTDGGRVKEYVSSSYSKEHQGEISDLLPLKAYTVIVTGRDRYGNEARPQTQIITTLSDTMPPRIEKLQDQKKVIGEGSAAETQLTVKIKLNEPSTVLVEAAKGVGASEFNINSNQTGLGIDHTITLKLGEPGIPYSYRVKVKDAAGNETISEVKTLVISSAKKSALEYIVSIFSRNFGWMKGLFE